MKLSLNKRLLKWLVSNQSPSESEEAYNFIYKLYRLLKLKGFDTRIDSYFNIYATKTKSPKEGLLYPCFVAHTDTAQPIHEKIDLIEERGLLFGWDGKKKVGAGFDDKAGICVALQLAEVLDNVKLFFPSDEEIGCLGSYNADLSFFSDVSFCAQPDRRGDSDFIYYTNGVQVLSEEFIKNITKTLEKNKYNLTTGTYTDIGTLVKRGVGICCFNISVGYQNEHTNKEYLDIKATEKCLNFLLEITRILQKKRWDHELNITEIFVLEEEKQHFYHEKLIDLTADLLYELEFIPNLPKEVKKIMNKLNFILYETT